MSFNEFSYPKARLRHQCVHCRETIAVGENHGKYVGVWDGVFQNWRFHLDCEEALNDCQDEDGILCDEFHARGKSCRPSAAAKETGRTER